MMAMFAVVGLIIISDVDANYHWRRKDVYADTKGEILRLVEALRNNDLPKEMKSTSVKVEDVSADVSDDIPADALDSSQLEKRGCKNHGATCNESHECCGGSSICSFDGRKKTCYIKMMERGYHGDSTAQ